MTREEAAEAALRSIELERQAIKHCGSLDNPMYQRLMRESAQAKWVAEDFLAQRALTETKE